MIETVRKADDTTAFMSVIMERLGLTHENTTHKTFVEAFTRLQKDAEECRQKLKSFFQAS